jgi:hypothetical protein
MSEDAHTSDEFPNQGFRVIERSFSEAFAKELQRRCSSATTTDNFYDILCALHDEWSPLPACEIHTPFWCLPGHNKI